MGNNPFNSFDHLVRAREQRGWNFNVERLVMSLLCRQRSINALLLSLDQASGRRDQEEIKTPF
jgi:hypothetical protein